VRPWIKGGSEDESQPLQVGLWIKELLLELHREGAWWLIAPGGPPVDQLGFGNGEGDVDWGGLSLERREEPLKEADIGPVRQRGYRDGKVIDVRDNERPGDFQVERGNINNE